MRLQIEEQLQPVLGLPQEAVGLGQSVGFVRREAPGNLQGFERDQRVALPHGREVAAVQELEELHGVLDVADAAAAGLHVGGRDPACRGRGFPTFAAARPARPQFHLSLQRLHLVDLGEAEVLPINEGLDGGEELAAEFEVPGDGPQLDERLPFPGAAARVVVAEGVGERAGERPALPFWAKPEVHAIGDAAIGVLREQAHDLPHHVGEELGVRDAAAPARDFTIVIVDEHQVDVAGVVEFVAAVLSERECGEVGGLPVRAHRLADAVRDGAHRVGEGHFE